jgi:NADPH:quinone reductase-like Zn-dependent oxidoreductase
VKAAVFDRPGPAHEVLEVRDVPTPTPGTGEVLVRMIASPVNPSDLAFTTGKYGLQPKYPATPGFEGVGVVEATGGGLLGRFLRGKRVVVVNSRTGNWAEYALASARQCFPVPADIPDEQAATFFVNPATALAITRHVFRIPNGAWLLQTAAGSALGKMVIRLGFQYGFRTINVVRRSEQVEELKRLGADEVLTEDEFTDDRVRTITKGTGVPFAMDPVGGATGTRAVQCLAAGGRAILYGMLSGEPVSVDPRLLITGSKRVEGFWLADWAKGRSLLQKLRMTREIRRHMRAGTTTTEIGATFPLDRVAEAVRAADAPGKPGKVLLSLRGTA